MEIKEQQEKQALLNMSLNSEEWKGATGIKRVFGGWIYLFYCEATDSITSAVFVPEVINCDVNINK